MDSTIIGPIQQSTFRLHWNLRPCVSRTWSCRVLFGYIGQYRKNAHNVVDYRMEHNNTSTENVVCVVSLIGALSSLRIALDRAPSPTPYTHSHTHTKHVSSCANFTSVVFYLWIPAGILARERAQLAPMWWNNLHHSAMRIKTYMCICTCIEFVCKALDLRNLKCIRNTPTQMYSFNSLW